MFEDFLEFYKKIYGCLVFWGVVSLEVGFVCSLLRSVGGWDVLFGFFLFVYLVRLFTVFFLVREGITDFCGVTCYV